MLLVLQLLSVAEYVPLHYIIIAFSLCSAVEATWLTALWLLNLLVALLSLPATPLLLVLPSHAPSLLL